MGRNLASTLAMISVLSILIASATPSQAADYSKVGVSAGDWADYSVRYYSTHPNDPDHEYVPAFSFLYNRVHVDIREVVGTNVTLTVTYVYPNQTVASHTYWVNLSENWGDHLMVAMLKAGDPIFDSNDTGVKTISETINMTVAGDERRVNRIDNLEILDMQSILYFDQLTGILVESQRSSLLFGWMVERIASTSLWSSGNSVWLWLGAGFAAGMAAIIIIIPASAARKKP